MRERGGSGLPGCDVDSTHSAKDAEWMGEPLRARTKFWLQSMERAPQKNK